MKRQLATLAVCLALVAPSRGQQLTAAEYFFDTDPGVGNGTSLSVTAADTVQFNGTVSAAGLADGFHMLYIRARNGAGTWSLAERRPIYIHSTVSAGTLNAAEYYFDTDPGVGNGTALAVTAADTIQFSGNVPAGSLAPGFHMLYIRARGNDGRWSLVERRPVYVQQPAANNPQLVAAEYFVDMDPGFMMADPITVAAGDTLDFTGMLPVANTDTGLHYLYIRAQDANGVWSLYEPREFTISNSIGLAEVEGDASFLYQNMPNPFSTQTVVAYDLASPGRVTFVVSDATGREVRRIEEGVQGAGKHRIVLDRAGLAAGCYTYRVTGAGLSMTRKMLVE